MTILYQYDIMAKVVTNQLKKHNNLSNFKKEKNLLHIFINKNKTL